MKQKPMKSKQSPSALFKLLAVVCLFLNSFFSVSAQDYFGSEKATVKIDSLYREDQFYLGFTYNLIKNTPKALANDTFSAGFSAGFLRDMPINKNRNLAFASGLGLAYHNYTQKASLVSTNSADYLQTTFSQLLLELPLEFRWRGSTFENHSFFRIHGGFKLGYLAYNQLDFSTGSGAIIAESPAFNKILYGTYLSAGYGGVNLYLYYGLNSIFKTAQIAGTSSEMRPLNIGLIFYIL